MIQSMVIFALGLDILEKYDLEKVSFKEDVNDRRSHLSDSDVEEECLTNYR